MPFTIPVSNSVINMQKDLSQRYLLVASTNCKYLFNKSVIIAMNFNRKLDCFFNIRCKSKTSKKVCIKPKKTMKKLEPAFDYLIIVIISISLGCFSLIPFVQLSGCFPILMYLSHFLIFSSITINLEKKYFNKCNQRQTKAARINSDKRFVCFDSLWLELIFKAHRITLKFIDYWIGVQRHRCLSVEYTKVTLLCVFISFYFECLLHFFCISF